MEKRFLVVLAVARGRCGRRRPLGRCDDVSRRVEATRARRAARTQATSVQPTRRPRPKQRRRTRRLPRGDLERTLPKRQGRRELLDEGADGRRAADGEDPPWRLAVLVACSVRVDRTGQCADEDVDSAEVRAPRIRSRRQTRASSPARPRRRTQATGTTRQCREPSRSTRPAPVGRARQAPRRAGRPPPARRLRRLSPLSDAVTALSLPQGLLDTGPAVIGATGGSGTRVVARILRDAGLFTGTELNESEDAWKLGDYSDRWINGYLSPTGDLPASRTGDARRPHRAPARPLRCARPGASLGLEGAAQHLPSPFLPPASSRPEVPPRRPRRARHGPFEQPEPAAKARGRRTDPCRPAPSGRGRSRCGAGSTCERRGTARSAWETATCASSSRTSARDPSRSRATSCASSTSRAIRHSRSTPWSPRARSAAGARVACDDRRARGARRARARRAGLRAVRPRRPRTYSASRGDGRRERGVLGGLRLDRSGRGVVGGLGRLPFPVVRRDPAADRALPPGGVDARDRARPREMDGLPARALRYAGDRRSRRGLHRGLQASAFAATTASAVT